MDQENKQKKTSNRTKRIFIRCSEKEYLQLLESSKNFKNLSSYLREVIFSTKKTIIEPTSFIKSMTELAVQVNKVGNNINQIAKYMNSEERINMNLNEELFSEVRSSLENYNFVLSKIETQFSELMKNI